MACRLITLNKNPSVRLISVRETLRHILAKVILSKTRGGDVQDVTDTALLCAGQLSGIEAAVQAVRSLFDDVRMEGALLVEYIKCILFTQQESHFAQHSTSLTFHGEHPH